MKRWTATVLLFAACVTVSAAANAGDPGSQLVRDTGDYTLSYSDYPVFKVRTKRYRLYFQYEPGSEVSLESAVSWVEEGIDRVEQHLGAPMDAEFSVFIPKDIVRKQDNFCNAIGVRFEKNNRHCVAFLRRAFCVGLVSHEVAHQWLSAHDARPATWSLEEGICEYLEFPGEYHPSRWKLLMEKGPLGGSEVSTATKSSDESPVRATRWMQVYWLRHVHPKRYSLIDIAKMTEDQLPDPQVAYRDLKKRWDDEQENERRERTQL